MRGQYFSFDAIVGSVIFVLALITLLSAWQNVRTLLDHQTDSLGLEALRIGEAVLGPGNANCDPVGLAFSWKDQRIASSKLEACRQQLTPEELQRRLGTPYKVSTEVWDGDNNRIAVLGADVQTLDRSRLQDIAHIRRIVPYVEEADGREQMVSMDVYVYR